MVAEPMRRLCAERPNVRLSLIGAGHVDWVGVPVARHPWTLETESGLLAAFDIGLMPLPDDPWTRGKGGYKILQYMAVGAPTVCSPVGINAAMVVDGVTGFHAVDEERWYDRLKRLVDDADLRRRMGAAARKRAEEVYSFETDAPILFEALKRVTHGRRR
jgi:glycosyltransferase involved in cell wall biosynthesis